MLIVIHNVNKEQINLWLYIRLYVKVEVALEGLLLWVYARFPCSSFTGNRASQPLGRTCSSVQIHHWRSEHFSYTSCQQWLMGKVCWLYMFVQPTCTSLLVVHVDLLEFLRWCWITRFFQFGECFTIFNKTAHKSYVIIEVMVTARNNN